MLVSRAPPPCICPSTPRATWSLRAQTDLWLLRLNFSSGGSRILGQVEPACAPALSISLPARAAVTACTAAGTGKLTALTTEATAVEALASMRRSGRWSSRPRRSAMAREALAVTHPVTPASPLSQDEIKGNWWRFWTRQTARWCGGPSASPILDGGGNGSLSPSRQRVAVLRRWRDSALRTASAAALAGRLDDAPRIDR